MKHLINILVIQILTGFAIGIAYLQITYTEQAWFLSYLPLSVFMLMWGLKLYDDYK